MNYRRKELIMRTYTKPEATVLGFAPELIRGAKSEPVEPDLKTPIAPDFESED